MSGQPVDNIPGNEAGSYRNGKTHDQANSKEYPAGFLAVFPPWAPANDKVAYDDLQHQHHQGRNGNPDHCTGSFIWSPNVHSSPPGPE